MPTGYGDVPASNGGRGSRHNRLPEGDLFPDFQPARTRQSFSLCSNSRMTDRPASLLMPTAKQMEKLAAEAARSPPLPAAAPHAPPPAASSQSLPPSPPHDPPPPPPPPRAS